MATTNGTVEPADIQVELPGRKKPGPKASTSKRIPRDTLSGMVASCNFVINISGYSEYALTNGEIDALSDALYDVLIQYPGASKFLLEGGKISPWIKLGFIAVPMATKRYALYQSKHPGTPGPEGDNVGGNSPQDETGPTRMFDRNDWLRENDTSESVPFPFEVGSSS